MEPSDFEKEKIERLRRRIYSRSLSGDIKPRPRHELHTEMPLVGEEWKEEVTEVAGIKVAPRFVGATRKLLSWFLVASIVFFVAALGVFGYYFTFGGGSARAHPSNIDIAVTGEPTVAGGEPTKLQISITNRNRTSLELAELVVTFPPGTRKVSDYASDLPKLREALGTIEPGGRRQGTIPAVFAGAAGETKPVKIELEYRVAGSNSIFVAATEYAVNFGTSPLSLAIDGNVQTVSGQPIELTIEIASNATAPQKDVLLQAHFPFGFSFVRSKPSAQVQGLWALGDFAPGERKKVTIEGILAGEQGDSRTFQFSAGTRASSTAETITTKLTENSFAMEIAEPFLGLAVLINGVEGGAVMRPGDNVTVVVQYENNLETAINDAIVVARLAGLKIDGATVNAIDGFFRSADDSVIWDKNTTGGKLSRLAPGARGTLTFNFVLPSSAELGGTTNPQLGISISAAGKRFSETGVPQNLQSATRETIRLATDLGLTVQALYYASPFGSSGPMPPKAGAETTYALVLTLTNTTNTIRGAKVTAVLPSYVRWIGSYIPSTEELSFDQSSGTFTWNVGEIAQGVGTSGSTPRQIAIAIGLTPSTSQIGEQPVLAHTLTLTGTDAATGVRITRTAKPDVTTNLAQVAKSSPDTVVGTDPGFSPANASVVR